MPCGAGVGAATSSPMGFGPNFPGGHPSPLVAGAFSDRISGPCLDVRSPRVNPRERNPMAEHVNSASDDRTANNAVRHTYRVLTDDEKAQMVALKDMGAAFIAKCQEIGASRELSLAITNAEQAVMWAVKHVTR